MPSYHHVAAGETSTVSLYTYDFDLCSNLSAAVKYKVGQYYSTSVYSDSYDDSNNPASGFEITVYYDTHSSRDTVEVSYYDLSTNEYIVVPFSGKGNDTILTTGGYHVFLSWRAFGTGISSGFCAKLTPVYYVDETRVHIDSLG